MASEARPVDRGRRHAGPLLADRREAAVRHRDDAAEADAEPAGHLRLHRERAFEVRIRQKSGERAEHGYGTAGVDAAVAPAARKRVREQLCHAAFSSERAVVRGVSTAVRAEETLEVAALQDIVLVPAPVEEVRRDAARGERAREEDERSDADSTGDERDTVGVEEVVDRERHAQRTEDGKRRSLGEARERRRSNPHDLDDELQRGNARHGRHVRDGERAAEVRAEPLAGLDHGEVARFRPGADRAGREKQGIVPFVVVDRLEDAERFVDGHREGGETRRARIMSEGRPAYHLPLAGALAGLAAGDLLLGLNPELQGARPAARLLLVAAVAGAIVGSPLAFLSRARRTPRAGAALGAGLLAAYGVFVEFQRQALHDFVPAGARRVLVATAMAAFLSAAILGVRAVRGGPSVQTLWLPLLLFLLPPFVGRRAPERPSPEASPAPLRPPRRNLLVVGLEGASWGLLTTYASEGAMPVVERLLREGTAGPLAALAPYDRAALWTTAATGKRPLKHGVVSSRRWETPGGPLRLLPVLPGSPVPGGERSLVDAAADRRSLTFWEILASRGHEAAVLGWPASSPAREGLVLWASDAFFDGDADATAALPAEAAARARLFRVPPDALDRPLARSLVPMALAADEGRRAARLLPVPRRPSRRDSRARRPGAHDLPVRACGMGAAAHARSHLALPARAKARGEPRCRAGRLRALRGSRREVGRSSHVRERPRSGADAARPRRRAPRPGH